MANVFLAGLACSQSAIYNPPVAPCLPVGYTWVNQRLQQISSRRQTVSESEKTFKRLPQYQGLFYNPCRDRGSKKHRCPDCHFCQECSPSRCNVCRETGTKPECKLSLQEQVALYEQTNTKRKVKDTNLQSAFYNLKSPP
jgi:transglutaminase/protease-like cytokinesis protein 3